MRPLPIVWQRLVNTEGQTCNRCGDTHAALQRAVSRLKTALAPLGVEPTFETREILNESFKKDTSASNKIWIAGKSLEEWLGAGVGSSRCASVCGDSECRTLEIGANVYEAIPEDLILKAGLLAAAQLLGSSDHPEERDACRPACCTGA